MFIEPDYRLICSFTVLGDPASKANSRRLVFNKKTHRPMFIKSDKAMAYADAAGWQIPRLATIIPKGVDVALRLRMYYANRRSDMDESLLLDAMQGRVYENDRQVQERWTTRWIDAKNPRVEVEVYVSGLSCFK